MRAFIISTLILIVFVLTSCTVDVEQQAKVASELFALLPQCKNISVSNNNNYKIKAEIYEETPIEDSLYLEYKAEYICMKLREEYEDVNFLEVKMYYAYSDQFYFFKSFDLKKFKPFHLRDSTFISMLEIVFNKFNYNDYYNIDMSLRELSKTNQFKDQFDGFADLLKKYSTSCGETPNSADYKNLRTGYELVSSAKSFSFENGTVDLELIGTLAEGLNFLFGHCEDKLVSKKDTLIFNDGLIVQ